MEKFYTLITLIAMIITPVKSIAQNSDHDISANVTLASDYLFRGQSQTDNAPSIQGGFDYSHDVGLYLGTWASNIDFAGGIEIDAYGGFAGEFVNGLGYDLTVIYYDYPSDDGLGEDYLEFGPSLNYSFGGDFDPNISIGFLYSDDYSLNSGNSFWVYSDLGLSLPNNFGLNFHVGNQTIEDEITWGTPDWLEYNVSLTKAIGPLDFALTYSDTDLSKDECFGGLNACDEKILFSISSSF